MNLQGALDLNLDRAPSLLQSLSAATHLLDNPVTPHLQVLLDLRSFCRILWLQPSWHHVVPKPGHLMKNHYVLASKVEASSSFHSKIPIFALPQSIAFIKRHTVSEFIEEYLELVTQPFAPTTSRDRRHAGQYVQEGLSQNTRRHLDTQNIGLNLALL